MAASIPPGRAQGAAGPQDGFTYVECLITVAILAIALLAHASGALAGFSFANCEEGRSVALATQREFIERLRADEDWEGLYARLWARVDPTTVPADRLYEPQEYYSDFVTPSELGTVRVRVEVPYASTGPGEPLVLREDVLQPAFGLPYDLDGDGAIDAAERNTDYRALPIVLRFTWQPAGEVGQAMRTLTWLTGERR